MKIAQLVHSTDPRTGGVAKAVHDLANEFSKMGISHVTFDHPANEIKEGFDFVVSHGLWQWPGLHSLTLKKKRRIPYIVFPHGMLDPWFKKAYPFKHLKKQFYWWWRQGKILREAYAVCFTTEEERRLAQKTFLPYKCREKVTGLGTIDPPSNLEQSKGCFQKLFPQIEGKRILLYLGRLHPKKGLDTLLDAFHKLSSEKEILVIAGPVDEKDPFHRKLKNKSIRLGDRVVWAGMLEGREKWGALGCADALILPSHQENYGMVVAEALSVGLPTYISNKVNLWREVINYKAGVVEDDSQEGIQKLVDTWISSKVHLKHEDMLRCFNEKLHVNRSAKTILELAENALS